MKISTRSRYALEALTYMAVYYPNEPVSIKSIASDINISAKYLEQIFLTLRKNGVLKAVRGAKGGFMIALSQEQVTVGMIVRGIETNVVPVVCVQDPTLCHSKIRNFCATRALWVKLSDAMSNTMDDISLAGLRAGYIERTGVEK